MYLKIRSLLFFRIFLLVGLLITGSSCDGYSNYRGVITGIITGFLVGVVASIIASFLYSWEQNKRRLERNRKNFEGLEGKYYHYEIGGVEMKGKQSSITYKPPKILTIETVTPKGHDWVGEITMDEDLPSYGSGRYQYKYSHKEVWGFIHIQIIPETKHILVHAIDTSQEKEIKVSYIMKKHS